MEVYPKLKEANNKEEAMELLRLREEALKAIDDAQFLLQQAKKLGISTRWEKEKLAKGSLEDRFFFSRMQSNTQMNVKIA